ncbi:hypothetical protein HPB47_001900, partial [Ixodes persulcatus]
VPGHLDHVHHGPDGNPGIGAARTSHPVSDAGAGPEGHVIDVTIIVEEATVTTDIAHTRDHEDPD